MVEMDDKRRNEHTITRPRSYSSFSFSFICPAGISDENPTRGHHPDQIGLDTCYRTRLCVIPSPNRLSKSVYSS